MLTRDQIDGSRSGNPFLEGERWIARRVLGMNLLLDRLQLSPDPCRLERG